MRRQVQLERLVAVDQVVFHVKEPDAAFGKHCHHLATRLTKNCRADHGVLAISLEDDRRIFQVPAPFELAQHKRITGFCCFRRIEGTGDDDMIAVHPFHRLLGAVYAKTAFHELSVNRIEFTDFNSIATAIGQLNKADAIIRCKTVAALEEPVATLCL